MDHIPLSTLKLVLGRQQVLLEFSIFSGFTIVSLRHKSTLQKIQVTWWYLNFPAELGSTVALLSSREQDRENTCLDVVLECLHVVESPCVASLGNAGRI